MMRQILNFVPTRAQFARKRAFFVAEEIFVPAKGYKHGHICSASRTKTGELVTFGSAI